MIRLHQDLCLFHHLGNGSLFGLRVVAIFEQFQKPRIEVVADELERKLVILQIAVARVVQLDRGDSGALGVEIDLEEIAGRRIQAADRDRLVLEDGRFFRFGRLGRWRLVAGLGGFLTLTLRVLLHIGGVGLRHGRCRVGLRRVGLGAVGIGGVGLGGAPAKAFCGLDFSACCATFFATGFFGTMRGRTNVCHPTRIPIERMMNRM